MCRLCRTVFELEFFEVDEFNIDTTGHLGDERHFLIRQKIIAVDNFLAFLWAIMQQNILYLAFNDV